MAIDSVSVNVYIKLRVWMVCTTTLILLLLFCLFIATTTKKEFRFVWITLYYYCDKAHRNVPTDLVCSQFKWIMYPGYAVHTRDLCSSTCWSLLYSAVLRSGADSLLSHVILQEWLDFYSAFLNIHRSGVLTVLTWLLPRKTAAVWARSVYTIQPRTMSLHAKPRT